MRYRLLGNSGLRVSEAALGTMTFGDDWGWGAAKDEARKVYDNFREAGGNFIDTANVYTNGTSESFLGEFMEGHRQSVVMATKYTNAFPGTDPNAAGNHRKSMVQAVVLQLRKLSRADDGDDRHRAVAKPRQRDLRHAATDLIGHSLDGGDDAVGPLLLRHKPLQHVAAHTARL